MKTILKKACVLATLISMTLFGVGKSFAGQEVKFLMPDALNTSLIYPEGQAVAMYYGALDLQFKNNQDLTGKYTARWVDNIYKSPEDILNAVVMGAGHFTYTTPYFIEQFDPEWRVLLVPGMFKDMDHFIRTMKTPEWQAKQDELAKTKGFKILKWTNKIGNFFIFTNKGPIQSFDDLKNLKIRYAGQQAFANAFKSLGIVGVAMPFTEVVSSLQTNMIDGHIDNIFAYKYFDMPRTAKYVIPYDFGPMPQALVVNSQWWDSLPEKERDAIAKAIELVDCQKYFDENELKLLEWWDKNPESEVIKFSSEMLEEWNKRIKEANVDFVKTVNPKLIDAINRTR